MNTLYTYGYQMGASAEVLAQAMAAQNITVADVRMNPVSRNAAWNKKRLQTLLGNHYVHVSALGNRNYKNGGEIELAAPAAGLATVSDLMQATHVLLLCACKDVHSCHRLTAGMLVQGALGCDLIHMTRDMMLAWAQLPTPPSAPRLMQLGLFEDEPAHQPDEGVAVAAGDDSPTDCSLCGATGAGDVNGYRLCQPCADKVQAYTDRLEVRLERLQKRADRHLTDFHTLHERAHEMADSIPFGQPIMVGHHSEGRDRRFRERIHNTFGRAFDHYHKAQATQERIEAAVSNRAISSDDPLAVIKLREAVAERQQQQAHMTAVNKVIRKHQKAGRDAQMSALLAMGLSEVEIAQVLTPDYLNRLGYPAYQLANNNMQIRRLLGRIDDIEKKNQRIADLEREAQRQQTAAAVETVKGVVILRSLDDNRIRLQFAGKPSAVVIQMLKRNGFRWSPSQMAWQRMLNAESEMKVRYLLDNLPDA